MKNPKFKIVGIVLLVGALVAAAAIQAFGPGLVATEHLNQPAQTADPNVSITITARTTYHLLLILPLVATVLVGVLLILVSRRDETHVV